MQQLRRHLPIIGLLMLLAIGTFVTGIGWGLPSRASDGCLFGDRTPWTGRQILELAGGWDTEQAIGSDIARNPLAHRDQILKLNQTDAQRAEIVRRYRLYTHQPDEMVTLRALAQMKPGQRQLDPKMYQYGGLWVYPVGGLLKLASMVGLVQLKSGPDGLAFYLDHPEAFGRFYIVARLYSAMWGVLGIPCVYWLTRRLVERGYAPIFASLCYLAMPVVITMAHEAKPHLAGAVLMLLTIIAAMKFVETGTWRWVIGTGCACGASFGMILTTLPIFAVLPMMALLRPMRWNRRLAITAIGILVGLSVYAITNPYVPYNLLFHRGVFQSNVGNYCNFYQIADILTGLANATRLMSEGAGVSVVALLIGLLILSQTERNRALIILLLIPAGLIFVQFSLLGAGKPGEYGRFLLFPDIIIVTLLIAWIARLPSRPALRIGVLSALALVILLAGSAYLWTYIRDARDGGTRTALAGALQRLISLHDSTLGLMAEPAPYSVPPVDLWRWRIVLLPNPTFALRCVFRGIKIFFLGWGSAIADLALKSGCSADLPS